MRIARIASLHLARERDLVVQQHVLGDLLGDGRGADRPPALAAYASCRRTPARAIASGSTPRWVQKFWSSAETKACLTTSGMALIGTKMRRSVASSAISRASPA